MELTKIRLLRILEILRETDEDHPYTAQQLKEKLMLYGIEAERKAILRDVAALQECGYEILLHADNKRGYYLAAREFEDWELKVLMDAAVGANFLTEENSKKLALKICSLASADGQKTLKGATPILSQVKNGNPTTKNAIDLILSAIRRKRMVSFQYLYTDENLEKKLSYDGMRYSVSPYALIWRQDKYYLIGSHKKYQTLSYYRLDRIKNAVISEESILPKEEILGQNADWKLRDYINRNLFNYSGEATRVMLAVDRNRMWVIEDAFGEQYELVSVNETKAIVNVSVSDGWGLNAWLIQNAEWVQILEPQAIRDSVLRLIEEMKSRYSNDL
ncbi:MAG: transcriptional regulator [Clostridia bacterium]|nr:transcriptional regulator [Clostridia bacterium]